MQAYEEERHAKLLENLLSHYAIPYPDDAAEKPRDPEWGFLRMGYGECFDSFFAFGLFKVASDTGFFAPPLVKVFDGVMEEEARHILFFSNWAAHRGHELPLVQRPVPRPAHRRRGAAGARAREDGAPAPRNGGMRRLHHAGAGRDRRRVTLVGSRRPACARTRAASRTTMRGSCARRSCRPRGPRPQVRAGRPG